MGKKILLILSLFSTLGLTSCVGEGEDSTSTSTSTSTSSSTSSSIEDPAIEVSTFSEINTLLETSDDLKVRFKDGTDTILLDTFVNIEKGKILEVDTNSRKFEAPSDYAEGLFINYGNLNFIANDSTFDFTTSANECKNMVSNFGNLELHGGTFTVKPKVDWSIFYTRTGGSSKFYGVNASGTTCINSQVDSYTEIHGGKYESSTYPIVENRGECLITAGEFISTSCSKCDPDWGYAVRSGESSSTAHLKIQGTSPDSVKVQGIQGGLAVIGGTADIYNGIYKTVACEHHNLDAVFYAGYFTGESYECSTNIYGGRFESEKNVAVLIGNSNPAPDSGAGKDSLVTIYDGEFIASIGTKEAIKVQNTEHAKGACSVIEGLFSSDVSSLVVEGSSLTPEGDNFRVSKNG